MNVSTPKVQVEVWDAKDRLYELVKHLSPSEQIKKLLSIGKSFADEIKKQKNYQKTAK